MNATLDQTLLDQMTEAALRGGAIALDYFRPGAKTSARIDSKEGGSPVTEADHAVDAFLAVELMRALPQAGWLSEETVDNPARLACDLAFIVDPIDGTRAFMTGDARWRSASRWWSGGCPSRGSCICPPWARPMSPIGAAGLFATGSGSRSPRAPASRAASSQARL